MFQNLPDKDKTLPVQTYISMLRLKLIKFNTRVMLDMDKLIFFVIPD